MLQIWKKLNLQQAGMLRFLQYYMPTMDFCFLVLKIRVTFSSVKNMSMMEAEAVFPSILENAYVYLPDYVCSSLSGVACEAEYPFRTLEGFCNNLKHPLWGAIARPTRRILKPRYADGKYK